MYIYKYKDKMYLKNNKNFLYIFIIATLAYHEQFLSVNVNNEEEKKEENNEPGLKKKIPEEIYFKGCCDCNGFITGQSFCSQDLVDVVKSERNISPTNIIKRILCGKQKTTDKEIDNLIEKTNNKQTKILLKIHKLIENWESTTNIEEEKEIKIEEVELTNLQKEEIKIKNIIVEQNLDPLKCLSRFIKIKNTIPCIYCQAVPQVENDEVKDRNDKIVIFFHGNGDSISNYFNILNTNQIFCDILNSKYDLAIVEYKGGAYYEGDFNEMDFREKDSQYIFNFFSQFYKPEKIFALGYSLGCAFAIQFTRAAEERGNKIGACILIYPFVNIKQAAKHIFKTQGGWWGNHFSWCIDIFLKKRFDNAKPLTNIKSDLVLIKNQRDNMCDPKSVDILAKAHVGKEAKTIYKWSIGNDIIKENEDNLIIEENKNEPKIELKQGSDKYCYVYEGIEVSHTQIPWGDIKKILNFLFEQKNRM